MNTRLYIIFALAILLAVPTVGNAQRKGARRATTEVKQDTLTILTQRAANGDATAQNTLGNWYYEGRNVERDYNKAAHWWAKAAQQQNADGVGNLALCYQLGRGLKADSVKALELYKRAIELGNKGIIPQHEKLAEGQNASLFSAQLMYQCYSRGIGVKRDEQKAAKYKAQLADVGDADQKFKLALDFINHQQPDKAIPWLRKAAKDKHVGATFYLGRLLYRGTGVAQDREQGIALMERAAEKDFPGACLEMGKLYLAGEEVKPDATKAASYLQKAAAASPEAGWLLAKCYLEGKGVAQDYHQAAQWVAEYVGSHQKELRSLLDENPAFAQYLEGMRLLQMKKDVEAAKACFKKVAKAKVAEGNTMLACCLQDQNNPKQNEKKAAKLMTKAAKGSASACYYLSEMYRQGNGVPRDDKQAVKWLEKAVNEGVAEAQCLMADRYMEGNGVAQDYVKAATLLLKAEAQRQLTPQAARRLARCYQLKVNGLPDLDKATERIDQLEKVQENLKIEELLKKL